jgi:hypothetical protein
MEQRTDPPDTPLVLEATDWTFRWVGVHGERPFNPDTDLEVEQSLEGIWWLYPDGGASLPFHAQRQEYRTRLVWEAGRERVALVRECAKTARGRDDLARRLATSVDGAPAQAAPPDGTKPIDTDPAVDPRTPLPFSVPLSAQETPAQAATRRLEQRLAQQRNPTLVQQNTEKARIAQVASRLLQARPKGTWEEIAPAVLLHPRTGMIVRHVESRSGTDVYAVVPPPSADAGDWKPAFIVQDRRDVPVDLLAEWLREAAAAQYWADTVTRIEDLRRSPAPSEGRTVEPLTSLVAEKRTEKSDRFPTHMSRLAAEFFRRAQSLHQSTAVWVPASCDARPVRGDGRVVRAGRAQWLAWDAATQRLRPPERSTLLSRLGGEPAPLRGMPQDAARILVAFLRQIDYLLTAVDPMSDRPPADAFGWTLRFTRPNGAAPVLAHITTRGIRVAPQEDDAPGIRRASWREADILVSAATACADAAEHLMRMETSRACLRLAD